MFLFLLYLYPVICLYRYSSRIKRLTQTGETDVLVSALDAQRSFWKTIGVMVVLGFVLYIAMGAFGAFQGMPGQPGMAPQFPSPAGGQ